MPIFFFFLEEPKNVAYFPSPSLRMGLDTKNGLLKVATIPYT